MPQPVDPNTEIMRITAAERIQQIADRASLAAQARHAAEAAEQRVDVESQVRQTAQKSEQVDEQLRRRNPFMGRRRRKRPPESTEARDSKPGEHAEGETESDGPPEHHRLDISI